MERLRRRTAIVVPAQAGIPFPLKVANVRRSGLPEKWDSRLRGNDESVFYYSATSKSSTTLSVSGKLWQLRTKPRATS
jgi:hypothetical protein